MNLNQKQKEALLSIFEYEQTHDPKEFSLGWSWSAVRVAPATLTSKAGLWDLVAEREPQILLIDELDKIVMPLIRQHYSA